MSPHAKAIPRSILIFGASGHIGRPLTEFLMLEAPSIRLRLATSNESKIAPLKNDFPKAEVVHADYYNPGSISAAVAAMEGIFVLPSSGLREEKPMTDLVRALKQSETVTQVIRLMGLFPEFPPACIASELGPGSLPAEHRVAKDILDGSGLPVTYVNCGATFMDNLFILMRSVSAKKTLVWPEHRVPFLDPRDIAEVVGRLFLSTSAGHIGAFHTMNNGHDLLNFEEVAGIISEVFDEPVGYDGSWEEFAGFYDSIMGRDKVQWLWRFFKFEEAHEEIWALNNFVEMTIGRKPVTVRQWLLEHKDELQRGSAYLGWAGHGR